MAISDQQIFDWFLANPEADDATIAATMDQFDVSLADIARATGTEDRVSEYSDRFGAVPTTTSTPTTNTQTFTDTITAGTPTTEDELLTTLADTTTGTTGADTTGTTTATTTDTTPTTYTKSFGGTDYSLDNADVDFLVNQILSQNLTSQWKGEGFGSPQANARAMAENLLASGVKDINQVGLIDKKVDEAVIPIFEYVNTGGYDENGPIVEARIVGYKDSKGNPVDASLVTQGTTYSGGDAGAYGNTYVAPIGTTKIIGNKTTGTGLISDYGERAIGNAFSGTYAGEGNTAYRVKFDDKGNPYFYTTGASSSDIADWGPILALASVIPSPLQPFAIAANAAISIDQGDVLGGIASLAGLAGFTDVAAGARIAKAVDSGDPFAIVTSVMNSPFAGNVGGTMLTDTISLRDAGNALSVANNVANENWAGALTAANQLVNSPDLATAAAAARFINAFENNNLAGMYTAANGFTNAMNAANKITDKDVALNLTNTLATANSAATEGTQLASLATDTVSDAGNGLTLSGAGGETLNFPDFTGSDSINADATLFDSSVGDLDATGNITDTTGLDMGDVIPGGDDNVEELVVTGTDTTGLDMGEVIPDTGTDTVVDDKGEVVVTAKAESCPVGTVLNPVTGDCDPVIDEDKVVVDDKGEVVITAKPESCPVGTVLNPETGECDPVTDEGEIVVTDKKESCPVGTKLNPETGECDPDWDEGGGEVCDSGFHQDPETGMCVPDETETKTITCPPGKVLNEAGTACIDETVIIGKPESCPVGTTLNLETGECDPVDDTECAEGFHLENGICVPDDDEECDDGYEKVNGTCVPVCKEGYIRNLETGACEKVEKECPVGQMRNAEGKCVPIPKTTECQPGFERINGVCVPVCQPGYQRVNGVCKKITKDAVIPTPTTSGLSAQGEKSDPIYAGDIDDFDLFATLQEVLASDSGKSDKKDTKKDNKKSKDKTKMATGGHLDDLLAEQMTVDDLLKLLR